MPNQTFLCKLCGCVVYAPSRDAHRRQKHQICSDCVYPDGERVTLEKDFATGKYHCRRCNYSNAVIRYMRTHISACHALSNPDDEDAASIEEVEDGLGPPPSQLARPSQCPPSQCPPSQCPPSQPPPTQPPPVHSQRRSRSSPPPVAVGTLCDPDDLFAPIPSPSPVSRSPPKSDLPASSPPSSSPLAPRPPSPDPLVTHLSDLSPPDNAEDEAANDDDPAPVVLPDDDTEVTSDFQRWGIVVNLAHNVVICVSCHKVVLASSVFTHLKSHGIFDLHSRDVSEALLPFSLIDTRAAIVPRIPFGASTINAIFGLNIIEDCAFCSVCHRGYGSVDSLKKNHFAVSNCNPARQYHEGPGQTFFTNNCRRVFPVSLPDPEPVDPSTSIFESFLATIICPDPALDPLSEPANDRSLSRFLARERWLDVVRKFPPAYLHYLIDEEPAHPFMKPIREVAHAYFEKVVQLLAYTSPHFKRQMAQYGDGPYGGAFSTVRPGTALQYSRYLARLVVFVLRAQEPTDSIHVVPLSEDQCIAAQRLVEALASQSDADLHGLLHTLLYALVTNTPSDATLDSFVFAISNFQVLTAVTAQGFLRTNDIRRLNAQLIYIIRSVMFTELVSRMQADNLQFYPVYQQLRPFLVAEAHTPFAYCAALSGILGSIESQEDMMPQFQFKDLQRKVILFHDIEFSHASVATVVRGAMAEYDSLLSSKLLCGLSKDDPAFRLPQDISKIFDQPQNHTPGFSFFEDTRNDLSHLQYALLRRLVEPHGSSGPFHYVHNERLVWVADSCLRFLRDAYEAEQRLCTMIHLSYGQPARGEELASMTYRNIPGGSARAVYVLHGMLVLVAGTGSAQKRPVATRSSFVRPLLKSLNACCSTSASYVLPSTFSPSFSCRRPMPTGSSTTCSPVCTRPPPARMSRRICAPTWRCTSGPLLASVTTGSSCLPLRGGTATQAWQPSPHTPTSTSVATKRRRSTPITASAPTCLVLATKKRSSRTSLPVHIGTMTQGLVRSSSRTSISLYSLRTQLSPHPRHLRRSQQPQSQGKSRPTSPTVFLPPSSLFFCRNLSSFSRGLRPS
ncbi:uncharacterized protein B0H18DRAFT_110228 [Fomitopsis serialis]|uniref:uncharacterized protein n=1 Tax=Fomitopsis serialis TaxID=139415 RepID=UPI002007E1BD|nr:uncharacterized protein B0H18DRAFT_110228 [Neoantrodia serialis]KAH9915096.1 hypothetical protein B0H18DRAFT_110228 [Neoantrodia serialis]